MKTLLVFISLILSSFWVKSQNSTTYNNDTIYPGAYNTSSYLPILKNKKLGVFANHTSTIGKEHLVDTLLNLGLNIVVAFAPEHGFRGNADAGDNIKNDKDPISGIPLISLYGKKNKPSPTDLKDVDLLIFDIQDVGTRFYTYISSLQYFLEAAIENHKPIMILDRPNPNGFYVDGPVLDTSFKSFVGMQPVPIVYGMTIGEYAKMLIGEKWLSKNANEKFANLSEDEKKAQFILVSCKNYTHHSKYKLPIKPSPNLPDMNSIYCYPSTCLFEGTNLSEGRGTDHPFAIFGAPNLPSNLYSFTPVSKIGAREPKYKDQRCFGWNLFNNQKNIFSQDENKLQLHWIIDAYRLYPDKNNFFLATHSNQTTSFYFNKLAGNSLLMKQIENGDSESDIRKSWEQELNKFKSIRKKYLIYPDFE